MLCSFAYHSSSIHLQPLSLPLVEALFAGGRGHALTTRQGQNWNGVMNSGHPHRESRNKTPQSGGYDWTEQTSLLLDVHLDARHLAASGSCPVRLAE